MTPPHRLAALLAVLAAALTACAGMNEGPPPVPPPQPAGVTAEATSSSTVHVMWHRAEEDSGTTGYEVLRDGDLVEELPVETYMTDVDGLLPDTGYTFTVRSVGAEGEYSAESVPVDVTTLGAETDDDQPPTAPRALEGAADGAHAATLTWQAATDDVAVTAYDIHQSGTRVHTVPGDTTDAVITGLRPATGYTFTVIARDAADNTSDPSGSLEITTPGDGAEEPAETGAPTDVTAVYRTTDDGAAIDLSWEPPAIGGDVADYEIHLDGSLVTTVLWGAGPPEGGPAYTLRVDGAPPEEGHTLALRARLPDGHWGAFSEEVSVSPDDAG